VSRRVGVMLSDFLFFTTRRPAAFITDCRGRRCTVAVWNTRKLCYRKDDRALTAQCAIYMVRLKFLGLPDYTHGYYSQHFSWAFVLIHLMNVPSKYQIRSFTRS